MYPFMTNIKLKIEKSLILKVKVLDILLEKQKTEVLGNKNENSFH